MTTRRRWTGAGSIVGGGALLIGSITSAPAQQPADRTRVAAEATGQAAEADRRYQLREFDRALPLYQAEQVSRQALGDRKGEAYAWRAIGCCLGERGEDGKAIDAWTRARGLDLEREDPGYAGYDDLLIAGAETRLGRTEEAVASLQRGLPRLGQAVDRDHEADARLLLARLLMGQDQTDQALIEADRAVALADLLGEAEPRRVAARELAAEAALGLNRWEVALGRFSEARDLADRRKDNAAVARLEAGRGEALGRLGKVDDALARFREAARLHATLRDGSAEALDRVAITGLLIDRDPRGDAATTEGRAALRVAEEADDPSAEVEARVVLARALGKRGVWLEAAEVLDPAVDLVRQHRRDDPAERVRILLQAATVDRLAHRSEKARTRFDQARALAEAAMSDPLRRAVAEAEAMAADSPKPRP